MTDHDGFVSDLAQHYEALGLSSTASRVLGLLLLEPDGSADTRTLLVRLGVAKSSLSVALSTLERFGLVFRRRTAGDRRERFVLAEDAFEAAFVSKLPALQAFLDLADRGLAVVPADSDTARRLRRMRSFYAYMLGEFPLLLERWSPDEAG